LMLLAGLNRSIVTSGPLRSYRYHHGRGSELLWFTEPRL
jgi:hypothetical protein